MATAYNTRTMTLAKQFMRSPLYDKYCASAPLYHTSAWIEQQQLQHEIGCEELHGAVQLLQTKAPAPTSQQLIDQLLLDEGYQDATPQEMRHYLTRLRQAVIKETARNAGEVAAKAIRGALMGQ